MKIFNRTSIKNRLKGKTLLKGVLAAMLLLPMTSCDDSFIYEQEGDCDPHYFVKYVFDMNMQYADAFSTRVNSVRLFIIDPETGDLVKEYVESGEALQSEGYRMPIDVEPGTYELIAWCGMENNKDHFVLPDAINKREDMHCRMAREYKDGQAEQSEFLTALFHGKIEATLPDTEGNHVVTIYLTKDTNNINLSMQHVGDQPLTRDMFTVTMTDGNGHMDFDNSIKDNESILYRPWTVTDGFVDVDRTRAEGDDATPLNFFKAELSTSRLMKDSDAHINIVANETGELVYSIPIVEWALKLRSEQYSDMEDQEYLDREDQYNVMLYLDNDKGWKAAQIYINNWRVVLHDDTVMGE